MSPIHATPDRLSSSPAGPAPKPSKPSRSHRSPSPEQVPEPPRPLRKSSWLCNATSIPEAVGDAHFQATAPTHVRGSAIFSNTAANAVTGIKSLKENIYQHESTHPLSPLQGITVAEAITSTYSTTFPHSTALASAARTDHSFFRADTRQTRQTASAGCTSHVKNVPGTRRSTRDQSEEMHPSPSISLPRLHGRAMTSLANKSKTWTSLKDAGASELPSALSCAMLRDDARCVSHFKLPRYGLIWQDSQGSLATAKLFSRFSPADEHGLWSLES